MTHFHYSGIFMQQFYPWFRDTLYKYFYIICAESIIKYSNRLYLCIPTYEKMKNKTFLYYTIFTFILKKSLLNIQFY